MENIQEYASERPYEGSPLQLQREVEFLRTDNKNLHDQLQSFWSTYVVPLQEWKDKHIKILEGQGYRFEIERLESENRALSDEIERLKSSQRFAISESIHLREENQRLRLDNMARESIKTRYNLVQGSDPSVFRFRELDGN